MIPTPIQLPSTPNQQRAWFLDQLQPGSPVNNEVLLLALHGAWTPAEVQDCLDHILERQAVLRIHFQYTEGKLWQILPPNTQLRLRLIPDVAPAKLLPEEDPLHPNLVREISFGFDITHGPLLRATLYGAGRAESALLLVAHQGILDGYSLSLLAQEMVRLLQRSPLPPLPPYHELPLFKDAPSANQTDSLSWWKARLHQAPSLEFTTDYPRPSSPSHQCVNQRFTLTGKVVGSLRDIAREERTTPTVVLLAALRIFLARSTGQQDFVLGASLPTPFRTQFSSHCGAFSSPLPLRLQRELSVSFREAIREERDALADTLPRGEVQLHTILEALRIERDMTRHPLFQAHLQVFEQEPATEPAVPSQVKQIHLPLRFSRFDLSLSLCLQGDVVDGWLNLGADLFRQSTARRFSEQLETLLSAALGSPDVPVAALPLLSQNERNRILYEWNRTDAPFPSETLLHELFEQQVARTPDQIAVEFQGETLTYR
ncbi:MAG: condensation domain-containing protein, partial [Myxococcales bacterium]|nr:condensation domain-containing protein [Polyangiaceae bacterium]MDW8251511.1 condensation domain-containing protein [Myxococcales bacterium]